MEIPHMNSTLTKQIVDELRNTFFTKRIWVHTRDIYYEYAFRISRSRAIWVHKCERYFLCWYLFNNRNLNFQRSRQCNILHACFFLLNNMSRRKTSSPKVYSLKISCKRILGTLLYWDFDSKSWIVAYFIWVNSYSALAHY